MKILNIALRTLAVTSAFGEFRKVRQTMLDESRAVVGQLSLIEKLFVYVPFPELPEDLEARRRQIRHDVFQLLRAGSVESLDAYYEILDRGIELARELGASEAFLKAFSQGLKTHYAFTKAAIDAQGPEAAQPGDQYTSGSNVSAMRRAFEAAYKPGRSIDDHIAEIEKSTAAEVKH